MKILNKQTIVIIIVVLGIGLILGYCNAPTKETIVSVVVPDSAANKRQADRYEKLLDDKQTWIDELLGTHKIAVPTSVTTSKPNPSPLEKEVIKYVRDTVEGKCKCPEVKQYPYDFPFYFVATTKQITLTTLNPYLEGKGLSFVKTYSFDREGENFSFATDKNMTEDASGIKLRWDDPIFRWRGWRIGGAASYPIEWYVYFKCRIEIYRIGIEPEIRSADRPLWLSIDYKF